MNTKVFKAGQIVRHNNIVGTIKEIDGVWITLTSGYVCRVEYCELYECSENEYDSVCSSICESAGVKNIWSVMTDFANFILFMRSLDYEYIKSDDQSESHIFRNFRKGFELLLHPVCYYPKQGTFRICNITVI